MKYLDQLKSETRVPVELPKLSKAPFDTFDSSEGRSFPENGSPSLEWAIPPEAPEPCLDCSHLEIIGGIGAGCLRELPESSPWREEWRRIPTHLTACNHQQTIFRATGYDCEKCGANDFQQIADGWRCRGCGFIFTWFDGNARPVVVH